MRTYDEIKADISTAIESSDSSALFTLADEMSALGTDQASMSAIHAQARAYRLAGAYPEALELFHRILAMYADAGDRVGMASTHIGLGIVYYLQGVYSESIVHYHRALDLNRDLGLRIGEAATLGNIGNVYHTLGAYPEALEYFQKALAIHDELDHRSGKAKDTTNIGILYNAIGSNREALEYYHKALTLHEELNDRDGIAKVTHNIGIVHADEGEFTKSIAQFQAALAINRAMNYSAGIAHVTGNFIDVLIRSGDIEAATMLQDQHASMLLTDPKINAGHFLNKGCILEHRNELQAARDAYLEALRIASDAGIRSKAADIHKHLRDLALRQNNLAAYVEHNNEYTRITEEINGKDTATKLALLEAEQKMAKERAEHEKHLSILHSTLPKTIADRVARGETVNDHFDNAAVIFLDIVGFTTISDQLSSSEVVQLLESVFTTLDAVCRKHDVVKIKTIGDSYLAVAFPSVPHSVRNDSSVPHSVRNDSSSSLNSGEDVVIPIEARGIAIRAASAALDMLHSISHIVSPAGSPIQVRLGVHCGAVTAGIIGTQRMQYDVWGDTVNVASRMESTSAPGRIHVSSSFALALKGELAKERKGEKTKERKGETDANPSASEEPGVCSQFPVPCSLIRRGETELKGKGTMTTYWLESPLS